MTENSKIYMGSNLVIYKFVRADSKENLHGQFELVKEENICRIERAARIEILVRQ